MSLTNEELLKTVEGINAASFKDEQERSKARATVAKLLSRIETPWENTFKIVWSYPSLLSAVKILADIQVFQKWKEQGGGEKNVEALSKLTGAEPELLSRLLRHLAAMNMIDVVAENTFVMNQHSEFIAHHGVPEVYSHAHATNYPGFKNLPVFLADTSYKHPVDPAHCNWQHMLGKDQNLFQYLTENPKEYQDFQTTMKVYSSQKASWIDLYPPQNLLTGAKPDRALVVDIGGGQGHDIEKLRVAQPDLPAGSLILQDLPPVVEKANVQEPVKVMPHDFFTPEPIKGARAYYLHMILHDWPDSKVLEILGNITPAMEKGYSKVLLHENVISPTDPHPHNTASDMTMMMVFAARERTEPVWHDVLGQAGLKITKIWTLPSATESIIEAELV